jgi:putative transposase
MNRIEDTTIEAVLEHLIADGAGGIGPAFTRMFELAMRPERERYLGAGHCERSGDRRGYANGYKPKRRGWRWPGTRRVQVPKTAGHEDTSPSTRSHSSVAGAPCAR